MEKNESKNPSKVGECNRGDSARWGKFGIKKYKLVVIKVEDKGEVWLRGVEYITIIKRFITCESIGIWWGTWDIYELYIGDKVILGWWWGISMVGVDGSISW